MKRLPLRMSLRVMLALIAVVALLFALEVRKWRARKSIAEAIRVYNDKGVGHIATRDVGPDWLRKLVGDDECFCEPKHILLGADWGPFDLKDPYDDDDLHEALSPIPSGRDSNTSV